MDAKTAAAEALGPLLERFHNVSGESLKAVWSIYVEGCLNTVILDFGRLSLAIEADPKADTVDFHIEKTTASDKIGYIDASSVPPWKSLIGEPFGWGWITVNQQGYCDGVVLSFRGIAPQVILNVVASSIRESTVTELPTVISGPG